jgi:purine-binding chemotaxis protein CheW
MRHQKLQILRFRLGGYEYGALLTQISEIARIVALTPFPNAPDFVEGVFEVRGEMVFAVDLRKRLGLPTDSLTANARIIIVPFNGRRIGFLVDEVEGFEDVGLEELVPREQVPRELINDLVFGVLKDKIGLLTLLNFAGVFLQQEIDALRHLELEGSEIIY